MMGLKMAGDKSFRSPLHTAEISIPVLNKTKICPSCTEEMSPLVRICSLCEETLRKNHTRALKIAKTRQVEQMGNLALIWGILSMLLGTILSPGVWFYAHQKEKECQKLRVQVPGTLRAGTLLGILGTALLILFVGVKIISALVIYTKLGGG